MDGRLRRHGIAPAAQTRTDQISTQHDRHYVTQNYRESYDTSLASASDDLDQLPYARGSPARADPQREPRFLLARRITCMAVDSHDAPPSEERRLLATESI